MSANANREGIRSSEDRAGGGGQRTGVARHTLDHLQTAAQRKQSDLLAWRQLLQGLKHLHPRPLLLFRPGVQHVEEQNIDGVLWRIDGEIRVLARRQRRRRRPRRHRCYRVLLESAQRLRRSVFAQLKVRRLESRDRLARLVGDHHIHDHYLRLRAENRDGGMRIAWYLSLIHIYEPTRRTPI